MTEPPEVYIGPDRTSGRRRCSRYAKTVASLATIIFFVLAYIIYPLLRNTVIHPEKPKFTLQDVTLYDFNLSAAEPSLLSSKLQATISSWNPNARYGIYYDSLGVYASYHDQQVTSRTEMPTTYEGHNSTSIWSMFISGTSVLVAPPTGVALSRDWGSGLVVVMIELDGQVRWELGAIAKGLYHITVKCPAYLTFGDYSTGTSLGNNAIKYQLLQTCGVDFSR